MSSLKTAALLVAIGLTSATTPTSATPATPDLGQQVQEVAAYLEGTMATASQAAANSKAPNVQMTTCRVHVASSGQTTDVIFLYQEQALAGQLEKPYRQRFLQLSPSSYSQSVRSLSYRPSNAAAWVNFCNKPLSDRTVSLSDLGKPVCSVFLKRLGDTYSGRTPADGCPANVRGAVRITNQIVLSKSGMDTWDRGYDSTGKQVWGAKTEAYQYRKVSQ